MKSLLSVLSVMCLLIGQGLLVQAADDDVPALLKALKSKSAKTRSSAISDLARIGAIKASDAREAIPQIVELLKKDKDADVRRAAAEALGRMDPDSKQAVPALLEAMKDKTPTVRTAAATALGQFPSEAKDIVPILQEAQKDKDKGVMRAAGMSMKSIRAQKK